MKSTMKQACLLLLILFSFSFVASAQKAKANKDTQQWRYEIEAVNTATQGNQLIKVWSYSKKPAVATEQAKKNAVHGIIFKGYVGTPTVPSQKALATNPNLEVEQADFFKFFFADGGKYMKYVSLSTDGAVAAEDRVKIGKEYKIGVIVAVNVAGLRKDLEDAGMIKGLGNGF
jgi:hypothetical protein